MIDARYFYFALMLVWTSNVFIWLHLDRPGLAVMNGIVALWFAFLTVSKRPS